jgi:hypothetical protein
MENPAKETVIIVHGTWANPKPDHISWYQIPDPQQQQPNFVAMLNSALEKRGSPARCWAHCKDNSEIFSWSGDNAWIERTRAALSLAAHINKLQADGWRCHVVAHSHGGNVVAEALPAVTQTIGQPTGISGTITTLGAPFIDAMSPIARILTRRRKFLKVLSWAAYLLFALLYLLMAVVLLITSPEDFFTPEELGSPAHHKLLVEFRSYVAIIAFLSVMALLVLLIYFLRRRPPSPGWNEYWDALAKRDWLCPFILSISTRMDEAWQLLHHMRNIPNPLAPKSGLITYLWKSHRAYTTRSCEVARIRGVSLFPEQSRLVKISVTAIWLLALFGAVELWSRRGIRPWRGLRFPYG